MYDLPAADPPEQYCCEEKGKPPEKGSRVLNSTQASGTGDIMETFRNQKMDETTGLPPD
jgi:hypothetical protein